MPSTHPQKYSPPKMHVLQWSPNPRAYKHRGVVMSVGGKAWPLEGNLQTNADTKLRGHFAYDFNITQCGHSVVPRLSTGTCPIARLPPTDVTAPRGLFTTSTCRQSGLI